MLKLSSTYTAMSWFPVHSALGAMIGFKLGYISEQAIPTNLNAILLPGFFLLNWLHVTSRQSIAALMVQFIFNNLNLTYATYNKNIMLFKSSY